MRTPLQSRDPLSAHEAGRDLPDLRVGHTEEMRLQLVLVFLGGAIGLLLVGLVIGLLV